MSKLACSSCGKGTENMRLLKKLTRVELESDKLRYERDELRKVVNGAMAETDKLTRDIASLQAENAKLRELVLHMYTCMGNVDADGNHECFSCEYEGSGCDYDCRMRELGIEVD